MKRLLSLLAIVAVSAATSYAVVHSTGNVTKDESVYDRIKRTGVIRCGYWTFPPIVEKDPNTGQLRGPAPALFEELAARLNLKVEWTEEVTFDIMTQGLQSGRYDSVCTGSWLTARVAREAIYTDHYLYSALLPLVRADDTRFDANLQRINQADVTIAVQDDALQEVASHSFPQAKQHTVPSLLPVSQLYEDVAAGKADVALADAGDLIHYIQQNPGKVKLIHADQPVRLYPWVFPVAPGEHDLVMMLNGALQEMVLAKDIQRVVFQHNIPRGTYEFVKPSVTLD